MRRTYVPSQLLWTSENKNRPSHIKQEVKLCWPSTRFNTCVLPPHNWIP